MLAAAVAGCEDAVVPAVIACCSCYLPCNAAMMERAVPPAIRYVYTETIEHTVLLQDKRRQKVMEAKQHLEKSWHTDDDSDGSRKL